MSENAISMEKPFSIKNIIGPMIAIILGMIMVILDSTAMNVALPGLMKDFNVDASTMQWSITGYTLAMSAVIPLAGWMSDRFGTKKIFAITVILFTLGSLLCSLAQTPNQLIFYRVLQGLGGGMVAPIGMAVIFRLAPPDKIGSVMGMLGIPMLLAPALGPVLSGYLVEYQSWHWIFLINFPIGILALLAALKFLPEFKQTQVVSLDILGIILAPITFASLAYAVSEGGKSWTSTETLTGLTIGIVGLILFIFVELRQKNPLLELRVFASSDFTRGIILSWILQVALFGTILLVPLYLQTVRGYGALETGIRLLPQAIASAVMMPIGGKLLDKWGARPQVIVGLSVITGALFMLSRVAVDTDISYILTALAMMGGGMGLSMMSLNTHVLQAAPPKLVHRVTPLTTAAQQVMVSFAAAGMIGFLTSRITENMTGKNPTDKAEFLSASVASYGDTFLLAASIAFFGVLLSTILRKPKKVQGAKKEDTPDATMMMGH